MSHFNFRFKIALKTTRVDFVDNFWRENRNTFEIVKNETFLKDFQTQCLAAKWVLKVNYG